MTTHTTKLTVFGVDYEVERMDEDGKLLYFTVFRITPTMRVRVSRSLATAEEALERATRDAAIISKHKTL